jgi:hypothetical protein
LNEVRSGELQPIIPGFHPDPTVCRVGDDYYLATSSFEYFPGAPIFHSRDLVSWTQLGNILSRRNQFRRGRSAPSTGIYGSTLRYHHGRFWFVTTNVSDFGSGQLIVSATDPSGPWSDPVWVPEAIGIDPDLCWDETGQAYLTWHVLHFGVAARGIHQAPINLDTGRLLEPARLLWEGSGLPAAEGPHLYRIGTYWYLVIAEGGTERGHCVTVARSTSIRGPFEPCPWNPVFTRRSTVHPVQSVGHADLVEAPDGRWAAVYLGSRPHGSTPGFHVLGRETFLTGVDWIDGWPRFDPGRFEVPIADTGFTDSFTGAEIDPRWVVPGGEPASLVLPDAAGGIRFAEEHPGPLCTRVCDLEWTADAVVENAGSLGLRVDQRHHCVITLQDGQAHVVVQIGDISHKSASIAVDAPTASLRIRVTEPTAPPVPIGDAGPDEIILSVGIGSSFTELARLDGRYFSTEVASGFTGRMLAVGSPDPTGRIRSVSYRPESS